MSILNYLPDCTCATWLALGIGLLLTTGSPATPIPRRPPPPPDWQPPRLVLPETAEQPVRLARVHIDTEVQGGQALTRVEMHFFNPNRRVLEGELQFPLLDGQQVVGLALDVDGRLRDAVPVAKARGRQVFEDVIRQQLDPALLEAATGNRYKLRLYPLPARGYRRVVLQILEQLPLDADGARLRLPLDYAEHLEQLELQVRVYATAAPRTPDSGPGGLSFARQGSFYEARLTRADYRGRELVELHIPGARQPEAASQRLDGGTWFRAEIPAPELPLRPRTLPGRVLLLWDASGSMGQPGRTRELALLDRYFRQLDRGEVVLVVFREVPEPARTFALADGDWSDLRQTLENIPYDGATRPERLTPVPGVGEALLLSDGHATYGDGGLPELGVPVFCISARPGSDNAALGLLAQRSGGRHLDLARLGDQAAADLLLGQPVQLVELGGAQVADLEQESGLPVDGRFLVAGAVTGPAARLRVRLRLPDGSHRHLEVAIPEPRDGALAGLTWARLRLARLQGERHLQQAEIRRLGQRFRLPTRETSLIVLDRVEDYARHRIEPPPELAAEYQRLLLAEQADQRRTRGTHLERVVTLFRDRQAWWERDFPGDTPPPPQAEQPAPWTGGAVAAAPGDAPFGDGAANPVLRQRAAAPETPLAAPALDDSGIAAHDDISPDLEVSAEPAPPGAPDTAPPAEPGLRIALKQWTPDAAYIRRLRAAPDRDLYAVYLDERPDWLDSTAFFLDAADLLLERGLTDLGLRVLSNLAEMDLENRHLLRILGYRLLQAGYPEPAIPILRQVLELAPDEPQSWRDLGLAYQDAGRFQEAVEHLYRVVEQPWDTRFPEIELIALTELNALLATAGQPVDTRHIDPRLLRNLPLDLRVILTWDADNSDMDLWVTDPNGEKSYYGNRLSYQGGRMSPDFTQGYGPEEYSLKRAKPGRYLVQANFFGHRQQVVAGATTLQLELFTGYGTPRQQRQSVTLRLQGPQEVVTVGEFQVEPPPSGNR
jgi:Ca-activated chloride channel family protein